MVVLGILNIEQGETFVTNERARASGTRMSALGH
jgi:hypothetical protein